MDSHRTRLWWEREQRYRRRLAVALALSVIVHLLLAVALGPLGRRMPLIRHIGYAGPLQVLPEISVLREQGEEETEVQTARGGGAESFFQVVPLEIVEWSVPPDETAGEETGEADEATGREELDQLERSLPQPRSEDIIITHMVKPVYPQSSIDAGIQGVVVYRLHVTRTGAVVRAWLVSSELDPACDRAAYRAIMKWEFMPYLENGRPSDILIDQRIRFQLHDPGSAAPEGGSP